ncbi:uncharacterized protein LOC144862934 isoform X4 [Branchiostoma floridae x Branchiostoma japonicum]
MASRSWFDRANDDVTAWWFRDLTRRGVISDRAEHPRQRRRPNRFKRWLLLERRRGLRKHRYFALVVEVGLSLAVIGLLIGLTLHVIGPVLFGIGCCLLIPSAFWFVWEFSYRTTEELEVRHMPRESDEDEGENAVNERNTVEDNVGRSREGVREDLPSVRDGGQIQVVVPSPPPYEEVTSEDRRHLGNQSEAGAAPRPPPYASVAEADERTRQQTSRTEEPRSSEQCPSYTEAIRSPTRASPTEEMPHELPPVPPPAYEEVVNR